MPVKTTTIDREAVLEMMNEAEAVYLATIEGEVPRIRALVNLRRRDLYPGPSQFCRREGFTVYLSTSASTRKPHELRAHPLASVYYCNPRQFQGVTLTGPVEILTDPTLKETLWDESWRIYFPMGAADPDYVVLRLKPTEAEGWWSEKRFSLAPEEL